MKYPPALRLATDLKDPEARETFEFAALADAPNTQRAYLADWKHFIAWCKKRNKSPLPVDPDSLAQYVRFCGEKLQLNMSTVRRRLSAITEAHKRNSYPSPCGEWIVTNTMRRLRRELGRPATGKNPILVKDLKEMIALCPPTLAGMRDKAVLLIGFSGAFRRSSINCSTLSTPCCAPTCCTTFIEFMGAQRAASSMLRPCSNPASRVEA